ncbi:MAG: amidohydrolase family protein [Anaerolineales bacterium]
MRKITNAIGLITILILVASCTPSTSSAATNGIVSGDTASDPAQAEISSPESPTLSISPGEEIIGNSISLLQGGDADTEVVHACQTSGLLRTGNGQTLPANPANQVNDNYMQFNVENDVLFNGQPTSRIQLDIEYCDQGTDGFLIQYDALSGGPFGDGRFSETDAVRKSNTQLIQTASFTLDDVNFADRDNGADFRIADLGDGAEAILKISITLIDTTQIAQTVSTAPADSSSGDTADIIFHNGFVITLEESQPLAEAIAIRDELIQAVGTDEEILALQGTDTLVIDLKGQALMPGFIDGHTHILAFPDRMGRTFAQAQETALRYGFTSLNEMWGDEDFINRLAQAEQQGTLRLRVNVFASYNDGVIDGDHQKVFIRAWYPEHDPILDSDRLVRIPGIKIFIDGDNWTPARGCWAFSEPHPASANSIISGLCANERGDLYWQQDELNQVVAQAQAAGYRVAFHAMGDGAIETALNAIEFALNGRPNEEVRHQIEHNSLIRPDLLARYEELNVPGSVRGYGDFCNLQELSADFGPGRITWYANRYALPGLDIHAYMETDFGWTADPDDRFHQRGLDPIMQLYGIVTHNLEGPDGTVCGPDPVVAAFAISVERALRMLTIDPAYAVSMEDYVGSLKPGKFADLIILSANPLEVAPEDLMDLRVWMTMVGGNTEYCASGKEPYCP